MSGEGLHFSYKIAFPNVKFLGEKKHNSMTDFLKKIK